jgi:GNAT superfamily N-acetyltransferase
MVELQQESLAPLPEDYTYDTSLRIPTDELAALKGLMGWDTSTLADFELALDTHRMENFNVGVRTPEGNLIGYGRLVYEDDHGELCDFMVNPEHRHQGIGRAIIDTRLAMAEASGVTSLYMPIDDDNTLRDYYLEHSFYEMGANLIARGPDPKPLLE